MSSHHQILPDALVAALLAGTAPQAEGGKYVPCSRWPLDYISIMGGR